MSDMIRSVSAKIGNREVRDAWNDYIDLVERASDPGYFFGGDFTEESFFEMVMEEAEVMKRLDMLCPNVTLDERLGYGGNDFY